MYNVEEYWSDVAKRMNLRKKNRLVAGDSEPFYEYKREKFLKLLITNAFKDKRVLEVGCGPGGNLLEVYSQGPKSLTGADISNQMVRLASENTKDLKDTNIVKIDGVSLPFEDNSFDLTYTATVLQHITDDKMLNSIVSEIARVSSNRIIIHERIETKFKGDALNHGRTVDFYKELFDINGFELKSVEFINIQTSYLMAGATRKLLNRKNRIEGEPLTRFSVAVQNILLPITKILDNVFKAKRDLGMLIFEKK